MNINHYDLIKKPIITEKSTMLNEQNKYTFEVSEFANKLGIKQAVENIFTVKVSKVNILNIKGKKKRFKGRLGIRSDIKKAIVTLEKDFTIDFAAGVR